MSMNGNGPSGFAPGRVTMASQMPLSFQTLLMHSLRIQTFQKRQQVKEYFYSQTEVVLRAHSSGQRALAKGNLSSPQA